MPAIEILREHRESLVPTQINGRRIRAGVHTSCPITGSGGLDSRLAHCASHSRESDQFFTRLQCPWEMIWNSLFLHGGGCDGAATNWFESRDLGCPRHQDLIENRYGTEMIGKTAVWIGIEWILSSALTRKKCFLGQIAKSNEKWVVEGLGKKTYILDSHEKTVWM